MTGTIAVDAVEFVKEFYPRLREDDAAIERYRAAVDLLPPIVLARGRVLVDGFHRWQAHKREGIAEIAFDDLGNLTDLEIVKESVRRNSTHGRQLETRDKRRMADQMYRHGVRDIADLAVLLSITEQTATKYVSDARRDEKQAQNDRVIDLWLDCMSTRDIAAAICGDDGTVQRWVASFRNKFENEAPESRQHFDIWSFGNDGQESSHFGRMPVGVVENLLWFYTEPGQIVVDPFAGGGTTIDVAKRMGRRVWASDLHPATPTLPIHEHDITTGWPDDAPKKADLILLDPPYWQQAKGRYSDDPTDLANMPLPGFQAEWGRLVKTCADHLTDGGRIAFIISPTQLEDGTVLDHAFDMAGDCITNNLQIERRVIVPYSTQQATGQQVTWARDGRRMLKLYRDLVVLR